MGSADRTLKFKFNPQQTGLTMVLGPLESEIMQVAWRLKRVTVADVHRELQNGSVSRRDIAYTTVMTTMSRLAEKNVLRREKPAGQVSFVYVPSLEQEEFINLVVKNVMDSLVNQFREPVMRYFVGYMAASEDEQQAALTPALTPPPAEAGPNSG